MSKLSQDLLNRTHIISKDLARNYILKYQSHRTEIVDGKYKGQDILPKAESFNATALNNVLNQKGCVGIRFYYGMDDNNLVVLVATGVDQEGNDLDLAIGQVSDPTLLQTAQRCPINCPAPSQINQ